MMEIKIHEDLVIKIEGDSLGILEYKITCDEINKRDGIMGKDKELLYEIKNLSISITRSL